MSFKPLHLRTIMVNKNFNDFISILMFLGKITIQGTYPTDLIAATYVNSIAAILLQIEDFTLVVRNQLTLKYVAFEAIDIHIDFGIGCPQLADPILCTCYGPNINTTLYSTTSTCSVLNKEAVLLNKVYSGFIQLSNNLY